MWLILALLAAASPDAAVAQSPQSVPAQAPSSAPGAGADAAIVAPAPPPAAAPGPPIPRPNVNVVAAPPPAASRLPEAIQVTAPVALPTEPARSIRNIPFELRVGGLLQVEYLGIVTEGHVARRLSDMAAPLAPAPPNTPPTPFLDESTLILRRARLSAGGFVGTPRLGYFVELEAGQGELALLEYRMRAELGHGLTLNIGQMRVPFSRSWVIRDDRLLFAERSSATEQFRYDYDIGISVDGRWLADRLTLTLGGFNGGGRVLARNDNLDPMLVLRVEATPVGAPLAAPVEGPTADPVSVVFGAAISADYVPTPPAYGYLSGDPQPPRQLVIDANADGLPDGITVLEAEIDAKATVRGFAAEAEGYYRHEAWHDIPVLQPASTTPFVPRNNYGGFFVQLFQLFETHDVVTGARLSFTELSPLSPGYQRYAPHSCLTSGGLTYGCNLPYSDQQLEISAVVVKRLIPRILQLSAMYSFFRWESTGPTPPPDPNEHRAIVVVQLAY